MRNRIVSSVKWFVLTLVFFLAGQQNLHAQRVNDSITVTLLTCSPGEMVYELYGHTAIRVTNYTLGTDAVFNYGVFDFKQPNFILRFMLGKTDYMVQPLPYPIFEDEYVRRGSSITSQQLNLTRDEANELYNRLLENARPENRSYRYNFLYCNCTTMVRDIVEASIHGTIQYKEQEKPTYRQCLHEFTKDSPWAQLGNDVLLGSDCDTLLTDRSSQFLPYRLQTYFGEATVYDSLCNARPLVVGDPVVLLEAKDRSLRAGFPLSPVACILIFCGLLLLVFALEYLLRRQFWVVDMLLMPGIGIAGLLVTFMFFFSEHPTLNSNWQIWVLNPIPLFCMPWVVVCAIKHRKCFYHYINAVILALFLVATPWIPQNYCVITIPLALALLTRPVSYIINFKRLKPRRVKTKSFASKSTKRK